MQAKICPFTKWPLQCQVNNNRLKVNHINGHVLCVLNMGYSFFPKHFKQCLSLTFKTTVTARHIQQNTKVLSLRNLQSEILNALLLGASYNLCVENIDAFLQAGQQVIFDLLNMKAVQASSCDLIGLFTFKWILLLNTPHHPNMRCDYPHQQQCETKRPPRKQRRNEGRRCTAVPHVFFSSKKQEQLTFVCL